ncbi:ABC transporter ATP-binding protein [Sulfuriferula nivalis]|nr:ABC transporter ATP-binding protein [Sulfuriferula nivalis]
MTVSAISVTNSILTEDFPAAWADEIRTQLASDEQVVAWMHLDLNAQLQFVDGLLVLTNKRLLATHIRQNSSWQVVDISVNSIMHRRDHAGVASIDVEDTSGRQATWHYTLAHNSAAQRLTQIFATRLHPPVVESDGAVCSNCLAPLPEGETDCAICEQVTTTAPSTWALLRLGRFARPYQWQLILSFMLTLGATAATLVPPYLTMPLMDNVLIPFQNGKPIDTHLVTLYLMGLFGAAVLAWGLGWWRTYLLARISERICMDLRLTTYEHMHTLSLAFFGGKRTGDLIARVGSETDRISVFLSLHLLDFATDVLVIIMTAVILASINPWLALVTLLPIPFIIWMIHVVRDKLKFGFEKADRVWAEISNVLTDTIPGIRVVKAFAQEHREMARFRDANQRNLQINDKVNAVWSLFAPTVSLLTEIGLLIVWAFGIWQVSHNEITVGVLTAFLAYISRFYARLDSMSRIVSVMQKAAAGAKRIFDILDNVSSVPEPVQPVHLPSVRGEIQLRNIGFRYGNRSVIRGLNLTIAPGEMIGLVGHSGSGKSTLVNLMCRFYDVTEGAIWIDGVDIRSLPVAEYRRHIGLVLQEPFLFFGTIAENIAYGKPGASRAEIVAAARAAHAHDFILRLPHGYDSLVGERGQALSGGERQRISIARALLIDPRILILDEATSSVDTTTEREIQAALENLVRGRTTIAVAHRLSTLRHANRLVVMDKGHIVEVGNHDDLLARNGMYTQLYEAQARQIDTEEGDEDA